jgi:hypothetical protein
LANIIILLDCAFYANNEATDTAHDQIQICTIFSRQAAILGEEIWLMQESSQALASLVCNGSRGTLLAVANSGAAGGLIPLLGCAEADILKLIELPEEFSLVHNTDQVALERLFRIDDIKDGATSRKTIPALVELLKPIPDRPAGCSIMLGY